jgi:hypothetical protein
MREKLATDKTGDDTCKTVYTLHCVQTNIALMEYMYTLLMKHFNLAKTIVADIPMKVWCICACVNYFTRAGWWSSVE